MKNKLLLQVSSHSSGLSLLHLGSLVESGVESEDLLTLLL